MARVYRVRCDDGSLRALKVLSVASPALCRRAEEERRAQSAVQHPGVIRVVDTIRIGQSPALVMEYVEGPNLDDWLKRYRLHVDAAVDLMYSIAAGVEAAHACGIVHRDLNPRNIVMDLSEVGAEPRLLDFGVAKLLDVERESITLRGMRLGTPSFQSPEQIVNSAAVDQRSDLFSLGCLFYEILSGKRAFAGENNLTIWSAVLEGKYEPLPPEIPDSIVAIVESLLQVDPDERLSSCSELLALLDLEFEFDPPTLTDVFLTDPEPQSWIDRFFGLWDVWTTVEVNPFGEPKPQPTVRRRVTPTRS